MGNFVRRASNDVAALARPIMIPFSMRCVTDKSVQLSLNIKGQ
jgi:hypothetical protein